MTAWWRPGGQPAMVGRPGSTDSLSPAGEQVLEAGVKEWQAARDAVDGALDLVQVEVSP